jgi:hypothetical protein
MRNCKKSLMLIGLALAFAHSSSAQFLGVGNPPDLTCPVTATATTVDVRCPVPISWRNYPDGKVLLATLTPTFAWSEDPKTGFRTVKAELRFQTYAFALGNKPSPPFSVRFDFFNEDGVPLFAIQKPFGGLYDCGEHTPLEEAMTYANPRMATRVKIKGEGGTWDKCTKK